MTQDLYFQYHFGWGELCSNSHRGNYDLSQHSQHSGKNLSMGEVIPQVIEVSFGVERLMLAILEDAYYEEIVTGTQLTRTVLKLHPLLAPYFVAIIPLSKQLETESFKSNRRSTLSFLSSGINSRIPFIHVDAILEMIRRSMRTNAAVGEVDSKVLQLIQCSRALA